MKLLKESINYINLYTIQHKTVLDTLLNGKTYIADYNHIFDKQYVPQYKRLANLLELKNCPIFCATAYSRNIINSSNINSTDDKILLRLKVPKAFVKLHQYYDWSDYLYFDALDSWDNSDISKSELENLIKSQQIHDIHTVQAVIDKIEPEWLIK